MYGSLRLTEKGGPAAADAPAAVEMLDQAAITDKELHAATVTLGRLELFWAILPDTKAAAA